MKKNLILVLVLFTGTMATLMADTLPENPHRQVVYEFGPNEYLNYNEHVVSFWMNDYKTAFVVSDEWFNKSFLMFNGEKIAQFEEILTEESQSRVSFVDPVDPKGYAFVYSVNEQWYVNLMGKVDGPYDRVQIIQNSAGKYGFAYQLMDYWYESFDGKISIPYRGGSPHLNMGKVTENGKFAYSFWINNQYYANVNDKILGPYDYVISDIRINSKGDFLFACKQNNYWYFVYNGKEFGPFHSFHSWKLTESGDYAFNPIDGGTTSLYINGRVIGSSTTIDQLHFFSKDVYSVRFINDKGFFIDCGKVQKGPFTSMYNLWLNEKGNYAYIYNNPFNQMMLVIDDKETGPIEEIVKLSGSGLNSFMSFKMDGKLYDFINGKFSEAGEIVGDDLENVNNNYHSKYYPLKTDIESDQINIQKNGKTFRFMRDYNYEFVVIDGMKFGNSAALSAWYNEVKHAFVWVAIEDEELVLYEYMLEK